MVLVVEVIEFFFFICFGVFLFLGFKYISCRILVDLFFVVSFRYLGRVRFLEFFLFIVYIWGGVCLG